LAYSSLATTGPSARSVSWTRCPCIPSGDGTWGRAGLILLEAGEGENCCHKRVPWMTMLLLDMVPKSRQMILACATAWVYAYLMAHLAKVLGGAAFGSDELYPCSAEPDRWTFRGLARFAQGRLGLCQRGGSRIIFRGVNDLVLDGWSRLLPWPPPSSSGRGYAWCAGTRNGG
jgi:hypothetical protein